MSDFEKADFEMEERLHKEDSSQLATSAESDDWAEGDSQNGEVEALESGGMDDSQEWTDDAGTEERVEEGDDAWAEEQADSAAQDITENLEEHGIYEALANEREETLQDQDSIDNDETGDGNEEAGDAIEDEGDGTEKTADGSDYLGDVTERAGDGTDGAGDGTDGAGHGTDGAEDGTEDTGDRTDGIADASEDAEGHYNSENKTEGLDEINDKQDPTADTMERAVDGIENAVDRTGEAGDGTKDAGDGTKDAGDGAENAAVGTQDERDGTEEAEDGTEDAGDGTDAGEVEWLMDESMSEDDDDVLQSQMETEAIADAVKLEDEPAPTLTRGALDEDDNNSTEDLLRLLGDGEETETAIKTEPQVTESPSLKKQHEAGNTDHDVHKVKDKDKRSTNLSFASESKPKSSESAPQSKPVANGRKSTDAKQPPKPNVSVFSKPVNLTGKWDTVGRVGNTIIKTTGPTVKADSKRVTAQSVVNEARPEAAKRGRVDDDRALRSKRIRTSIAIDKSSMYRTNTQPTGRDSNTGNQKENERTVSKQSIAKIDEDSLGSSLGESDEELEHLLRGAKAWKRHEEAELGDDTSDEDTDDLLDSLSSSEDEEGYANYGFTLDVRNERASEFLPLLGRDAGPLLNIQKNSLVTKLVSLVDEHAQVRERMRQRSTELKELRAALAHLNGQLRA